MNDFGKETKRKREGLGIKSFMLFSVLVPVQKKNNKARTRRGKEERGLARCEKKPRQVTDLRWYQVFLS